MNKLKPMFNISTMDGLFNMRGKAYNKDLRACAGLARRMIKYIRPTQEVTEISIVTVPSLNIHHLNAPTKVNLQTINVVENIQTVQHSEPTNYNPSCDDATTFMETVENGVVVTMMRILRALQWLNLNVDAVKEMKTKTQNYADNCTNPALAKTQMGDDLYETTVGRWDVGDILLKHPQGTIGDAIGRNAAVIALLYGERGNGNIMDHYVKFYGPYLTICAEDWNMELVAKLETLYWKLVWAKTIQTLDDLNLLEDALKTQELAIMSIGKDVSWRERKTQLNLKNVNEDAITRYMQLDGTNMLTTVKTLMVGQNKKSPQDQVMAAEAIINDAETVDQIIDSLDKKLNESTNTNQTTENELDQNSGCNIF